MKSWKTTVAGIASIVAAIATALASVLDSDAATVANWDLVVVSLTAGLGLVFARDNDKSSQDVGARPDPGNRYKFPYASVVLLGCLLCLQGCSTADSEPFQPVAAGEESQGWTDADQRDIRIAIRLEPGSSLTHNTIELWVDAVSGNDRDGKGAAQRGGAIGDTVQTPTTDVKPTTTLEIPLTP